MGHHACHPDPLPVGVLGKFHHRHHSPTVEFLSQKPGGVTIRGHSGGPEVGYCLLGFVHAREPRGVHPLDQAQTARSRPGRRTRDPQCFATLQGPTVTTTETTESPGGRQRLHLGAVETRPTHEVIGTRVGSSGDDLLRQVLADPPDRGETQPNRRTAPPPCLRSAVLADPILVLFFEGRVPTGGVQVGGQHLHTMTTCILGERLG